MAALVGKVAIVTGASAPNGIGRAIARRLAQEGASLFVVAEGPRVELEAAAAECGKLNPTGRAEFEEIDLAREGAAEAMVAQAEKLFGRVDILVNNAGVRARRKIGEFSRADFNHAVAVNLAAPFFASQAVIPAMRRQGGGRIIHIASQMGVVTHDRRAVYGMTKAGLIYLAKSMAYELGAENIVVNAISPGPVLTEHIRDLIEKQPELGKQRLEYIPAKRFGTAEEIAELAAFLATTPATYLLGANIVIDGGYTTH
jgi:NAD(P)-dependent dehydrogenase (short-subunit alcohol dehydrogenase family)